MDANLKGRLREPFLRLKWKIKQRAKIKDAYYSVKSIKEILIRERQLYDLLLHEERHNVKDENKICELQGRLKELQQLFV